MGITDGWFVGGMIAECVISVSMSSNEAEGSLPGLPERPLRLILPRLSGLLDLYSITGPVGDTKPQRTTEVSVLSANVSGGLDLTVDGILEICVYSIAGPVAGGPRESSERPAEA